MKSMVLIVLALMASGCALFDRGQESTTAYDDDYATYAAQKSGTLDAYDELGYAPSKRLSEEEQMNLDRRLRVRRLEKGLQTVKEREQYFNYKPYLETDDDKIAFLSIPSQDARDRYAMQKGFYFKTNKFAPSVKEAVSRSDIILGMTKDAVVESWGEPEAIEVAGSGMYGNERWRYTEYIATSEGYQKEDRVVIFEGGKVVGWQKY